MGEEAGGCLLPGSCQLAPGCSSELRPDPVLRRPLLVGRLGKGRFRGRVWGSWEFRGFRG